MGKIDRLKKLISEADETYKQTVIRILDEIVPTIDLEARNEVAEKICWDKHGQMSPDEILLMYDGRAFSNPALTDILTERIQHTRNENKDLKPNIAKNYWCETCGSHSHEENPNTGYCYYCNTDNWEPEEWRQII